MHERYSQARILRLVASVLIACALVSCASRNELPAAKPKVETNTSRASPAPSASKGGGRHAREEIVERGTGSFLGPPASRSKPGREKGDIDLRFDAVDIKEFARVVLGDLLKVNYTIDPKVSGKVTVHTTTPLTRAQLLPLFEKLLAANNAALIRSGELYRVVTREAATKSAEPLSIASGATTPGFTTLVIPLKYISALEMQGILAKIVTGAEKIRIDQARNLVIVSGDAPELQTILDTIKIFDVDWLRGMSVGLYPLDYVQPEKLEAELKQVLNAATGGEAKGLLGGVARLVPLDRLSSLLVVSSTPNGLREVETWIRRLDQPGESSGRRLYVYPVQNAKASDLADILNSVFGSRAEAPGGGANSATAAKTTTATGTATNQLLAPGLSPVQIGAARRGVSAPQSNNLEGTAATAPAGSPANGLALPANASVEIIADDIRNSLLILASPQDYRMIETALHRLDVVPLQVLIEAKILEVTLHGDLSYGVEWFFKNAANEKYDRSATLDVGSAGISALAPAFSYTVVDSADQVRLALNLLASKSHLKVLSSPSLMVLDNQTAKINVGDEIPVPTRQAISNLAPASPTVNEISYRQTGVTLTVTPRVNNSGLVTMDILQEVASAAATTTSNIDAPTIQNRQIESVVAVNSGDTIVLGGLIQDQRSKGESGVPGLFRIPVIGKLFGRTVGTHARTELLVLITPRVVRDQDDARRVTEEFRRKLPELRSMGAQSMGGAAGGH